MVENQLTTWAELFRAGKKLRVTISFSYKEIRSHVSTNHQGRTNKRGTNSATQQMLAKRDALLDAEQDSMGHPSVWRYIYDLIRCTGPPCHLGPHYWRDPDGKKYYRLKTHHLKGLVQYVEQGGELCGHGDVPNTFRDQLYAEEQQHAERQQKDRRC